MKKIVSFGLFDAGETVLGALVFSTAFPLFISSYIDTKIYSILYGTGFIFSFFLALYFGKIADKKGKRKEFFVLFSILTGFSVIFIYFFIHNPYIALFLFILSAVFHQQSFIFYNTLLLSFKEKGIASGFGVSLGYIASAVSLIFLASKLKIPEVFAVCGAIFLLLSFPSFLFIENPGEKGQFSLKNLLKDREFMFLIISILSLTEVANTLIAMMGIYLKNVYSLNDYEIYKVIGFSALGGVFGGIFWGFFSDKRDIRKTFLYGFFMWIFLLMILPFTSKEFIIFAGFFAGFSLAHLWTTSRLLILLLFPPGEISTRMAFLSLTERIATTTGLFVWSFFLYITKDNYPMSVFLMSLFPITGLVLFKRIFLK